MWEPVRRFCGPVTSAPVTDSSTFGQESLVMTLKRETITAGQHRVTESQGAAGRQLVWITALLLMAHVVLGHCSWERGARGMGTGGGGGAPGLPTLVGTEVTLGAAAIRPHERLLTLVFPLFATS